MKLTGENRSTRGKTCPSATLSTTNPTWTDPGSSPVLRGRRPATNRLSHGKSRYSAGEVCRLNLDVSNLSRCSLLEKWDVRFECLPCARVFVWCWSERRIKLGSQRDSKIQQEDPLDRSCARYIVWSLRTEQASATHKAACLVWLIYILRKSELQREGKTLPGPGRRGKSLLKKGNTEAPYLKVPYFWTKSGKKKEKVFCCEQICCSELSGLLLFRDAFFALTKLQWQIPSFCFHRV